MVDNVVLHFIQRNVVLEHRGLLTAPKRHFISLIILFSKLHYTFLRKYKN